ncbi:hypothetical protein Tco_0066643 [Tanacetum coccineum]
MTTEGSSFGQPNILKFNGDHDHWGLLMENLLRSKEYRIIVENGIPKKGEKLFKFKRSHDGEYIQALKVTFDDSRGGRRGGRYSPRGRGRRRRTMQSRDMVECYKCHKLRHYQFEFPDWNKETNDTAIDDNEGEEEGEMLIIAYTKMIEEAPQATSAGSSTQAIGLKRVGYASKDGVTI